MWPSVRTRFGCGRSGGCAICQAIWPRHGLRVHVIAHAWDGEERVKQQPHPGRALAQTKFSEATDLLERPYRSAAQVVRGRGLGRGLGLATANLQVRRSQNSCLAESGLRRLGAPGLAAAA